MVVWFGYNKNSMNGKNFVHLLVRQMSSMDIYIAYIF